MRQNTSRTKPRTDIDLALERTGSMRNLSDQDRAAFIRVAELLGCDTAAQHIRDDERRRERVQAAPAPAPRPGPAPRPTPPRPPLLVALDGDQAAASPADQRREHLLRVARAAQDAATAPWATPIEAAAWAALASRSRRAAARTR